MSKVSAGPDLRLVTVFVGDAQPLFRDGLVRAIRQRASLQLAGEADDGAVALEAIRRLRPAVTVLSAPLPTIDADAVLRTLTRERHATRVVLLLPAVTPDEAVDAVSRGAVACLSRTVSGERLCHAIEAAARGEAYFAPEVQTQLAAGVRRRLAGESQGLTRREQEILRCIAAGGNRAVIAAELHVAEATVKTHLSHLYEKLGVSDRASAVYAGMQRGLLD
jgi:two-component system, NarL family, nitrate/nitrite response regulator NarL